MRRKKKLSLLVAFLFFHLPDLISTCCNLIKNYERWGGGKKELLYNVDIHARIVLHGSVNCIFSNGGRESPRKKRKEKWEKKEKFALPSLLPRSSFLNGWKLRLILTEPLLIHRIIVQRSFSSRLIYTGSTLNVDLHLARFKTGTFSTLLVPWAKLYRCRIIVTFLQPFSRTDER